MESEFVNCIARINQWCWVTLLAALIAMAIIISRNGRWVKLGIPELETREAIDGGNEILIKSSGTRNSGGFRCNSAEMVYSVPRRLGGYSY
jgi:hypothetical protein